MYVYIILQYNNTVVDVNGDSSAIILDYSVTVVY